MIGVALPASEKSIISEFFELFKTPWDWFSPDKSFEVVISDNAELNCSTAKLMIVLQPSDMRASSSVQGSTEAPKWARHGSTVFPVYAHIVEVVHGIKLIETVESDVCIASYSRIGDQTVIHLGYDLFLETKFLLTHGQPVSCANVQTLDIHINNLREWILFVGVDLIEIPPIPLDAKYFACLTHDVDFAGLRYHLFDNTAAGFAFRAIFNSIKHYISGEYTLRMVLQNWMAVLKLPLVYLGLARDPWNTFSLYRTIEGEAPSTFFFVPFKGEPGHVRTGKAPSIRAVKYNINSLVKEIKQLIASRCEIGVHGIDSWADSIRGRREFSEVEKIVAGAALGVRMHWLYFSSESPAKLEAAGYYYDSTSGYNETVGYKSGTSQVYKLPGTERLFELPMHIMDTALFYPDRLNLSLSEGLSQIREMIANAPVMGGALTFNWHDRSAAPERLWDKVYADAISEMRASGAVFLTAKEVVDWFDIRRKVVFRRTIGGKIRVSLPDHCSVNTIVLRSYHCGLDVNSRDYVDIPLRGSIEL